jgi:predicted RNase H-like HicB family nuclease
MRVEIQRETDGRFLASFPDLPGVMAYGVSEDEAIREAEAIAEEVLADMIEHGERVPDAYCGVRRSTWSGSLSRM